MDININNLEWTEEAAGTLKGYRTATIYLGMTKFTFVRSPMGNLGHAFWWEEETFVNYALGVWAEQRKQHKAEIQALETRIAQLELMPSDQTWAAATEAVASEITKIKYRQE
jgi:hypothetical protein